MNFVLVAVNAKYIHSSASVRGLSAYARAQGAPVFEAREFTINQSEGYISAQLFRMKPDAVFFSCYIWNIGLIVQVIKTLRKVCPQVRIVCGGPEASYEYESLLSVADVVAVGEGEATFVHLLRHFAEGTPDLCGIPGIAFRDDKGTRFTGQVPPLDLADIPFTYDEEGLASLSNRILYYEASRGCPFRCQYCLSSAGRGVRYLPLPRVFADLAFFLAHGVKQVKFIDRTFNGNPERAFAICQFLMDNDNGITNFHFEAAAGLLNDALIDCFRTARKGLFQLEIGVQSTNPETLAAIQRPNDYGKLAEAVRAINEAGRTHLHLDLIAGLPHEGYGSFGRSFNDVYALAPQQLQLGFLKLLKGSGLRRNAGQYGIVGMDAAPYEVLFTAALPHEDVLRLKDIENVLDMFYNAGRFKRALACLVRQYDTPFAFYEALAGYWIENGFEGYAHNRVQMYTRLRDFCIENHTDAVPLVTDMLLYDLLETGKVSLSDWMRICEPLAAVQRRFYDDAQAIAAIAPHLAKHPSSHLHRTCRLAHLRHDADTGALRDAYYLFDYHAGGGVAVYDATDYIRSE